ncbi:MAG: hypothetical protein AAFY41_00760 [Bacteroidota bacterium]
MSTLKLKKKDAHLIIPMDDQGNFELYFPKGQLDVNSLPDLVEIGGTGKHAQKFHVNLSMPVKHRHVVGANVPEDTNGIQVEGNRILGDHDRLILMSEDLYKRKLEEIEESEQNKDEQENQSEPA